MFWVWNPDKGDFADFFLNVVIGLVPGVVLLLLAGLAVCTHRDRWHQPLDTLVPSYGRLGPISRIHKSSWAFWRQTSTTIFALVSLVFFLLTFLLTQIENRGDSANPHRWRSLGCLVLCADACTAIAFYKSRRVSPRLFHLHSTALRSLQLFWLLIVCVAAIRLWSSFHQLAFSGDPTYPSCGGVEWRVIWIAEPFIDIGMACTAFFAYSKRGYHRDNILGSLKETFVDDNVTQQARAAAMRTQGGRQMSVRVSDAESADLALLEKLVAAEDRKETPEYGAGLWKTITFTWMEKLIRLGNKRAYVFDDFYDTPADDQPAVLYSRFKKLWESRLQRAPVKRWTLANVMYKFSLPMTNFAALYKFVYDSLLMLSPIFLNLLLKFMTERADGDETATRLKGLVYVALFTLNMFLQTVLLHQYFHIQYMLGLQIRSALSTAVYDKALVLDRVASDGDTGADFSSGKVVNLMAVDTQRVADLMAYIHIFWSAPYQIIVTCVLLWFQMQWACFAGIGIMILGVPLTRWVVGKMRKIQRGLMNEKDLRIKKTSETLQGIRAVKFYAWEQPRTDEIAGVRATELGLLWKIQLINIGNRTLMVALPALVAVASFAVYTLGMNKDLTPAKAFTALSLFNNLRFPLAVLPNIIASITEASVTIERIQKYLLLPNLRLKPFVPLQSEPSSPAEGATAVPEPSKVSTRVELQDLTVQIAPMPAMVSNLSLQLSAGQVTAIVGRTGCGKTALISTVLGDLPPTTGAAIARGSVAFCAQTAWIQTGSVRDNIVFSAAFEPERYQRTLEACALVDDLAILADGDQTEIGERGINLSGGQKQRVALARAVYRDADVYIFDDVLSAVDAHVAEHIFSHVMVGMLRTKAIILVTHRFEMLGRCHQIVFMKGGGECSVFDSVDAAQRDAQFRELAAETLSRAEQTVSTPQHAATPVALSTEASFTPPQTRTSRHSMSVGQVPSGTNAPPDITGSPSFIEPYLEGHPPESDSDVEDAKRASRHDSVARAASRTFPHKRSRSNRTTTGDESTAHVELPPRKDRIALIEEERMEVGAVAGAVYKAYFKACGKGSWWTTIIMSLLMIAAQVLQVLSSTWLSYWSARSDPDKSPFVSSGAGIGGYGGFNLAYIVLSALASFALAVAAQRASLFFHSRLLQRVVRATLGFFESTPIGRIISRFSKDMQAIDDTIPMTLYQFMWNLVQIISVIVVICCVLPWMILGIVPMIAIYLYVERLYVNVVRQFRRIESVLRAPVISNFSESFEGATTIRSYRALDHFRLLHMDRLNANLSAIYISNASNRWLAVRVETLGTLLIVCVSLLSVLLDSTSAALSGLALSYAISCVNGLNWLVRMSGDREANVVAVERIIEYERDAVCPQEKYVSTLDPTTKQPSPGAIEFRSVCLQYRPGLPFALRNVSFQIAPGEKIGVVGRTGAGKSSLLVALLRLTEVNDGEVWIHGLETSPMSVTEIRSSISIIPQDSVLFSGTLRRNLDPFNESSDDLLWQTLKRACLDEYVKALPDGLDYLVAEGGNNLSAGQRQLLCLARVLLKNSSILLLDEATSAVDPQTDALIQNTIRTEFTACTILTIAHRIRTVMDYDKIMVMAEGRVAEFGPPKELLRDPNGLFSGLCRAAGDD